MEETYCVIIHNTHTRFLSLSHTAYSVGLDQKTNPPPSSLPMITHFTIISGMENIRKRERRA